MKRNKRLKECKFMYNLLCIILGASFLMLFSTSMRIKKIAEELPTMCGISSPYLQHAGFFLKLLSFTLLFSFIMAITIRIGYNNGKKDQDESKEKEEENK